MHYLTLRRRASGGPSSRRPHRPSARGVRFGLWFTAAVLLMVWHVGGMHAAFAVDAVRIKVAVERGAGYLRKSQQADGGWNSWGRGHETGETALAGVALLAAGLPANDPAVQGAARLVRQQVARDSATYNISLAIMFLDRLGEAGDEPLLRRLSGSLAAGQCQDGSWSYTVPFDGGVGQRGPAGDNSNTQFAALAAWIGRQHGSDNDPAIQGVDGYFRRTFNANVGGWGYSGFGNPTPSMTCAGLVAIATQRAAEQQRFSRVGRELPGQPSRNIPGRNRRPAADDPMARVALMAVGRELQQADRFPAADINRDLYFFWSLERVGVIYGLDSVGGVDWYRWGANRLMTMQGPDGQWQGKGKWSYQGSVGTSFAILFLCRANVVPDLTAEIGAGRGARSDLEGSASERAIEDASGGGGGTMAIAPVRSRPVPPVKQPERAAAPPPVSLDPR